MRNNEESKLKTKLVADIRKEGHYARRIEDEFSVGFPDMIIIPKDGPVFITEAKVIRTKSFKPSPRQFVELCRLNISPHSVPCLLGFMWGELYLHPVAETAILDKCTKKSGDESIIDFFMRFHKEITGNV